MLFRSLACIVLFSVGSLARSVMSADSPNWNRFRGPNGSGRGVASGVPNIWQKENTLWTVKLPGTGHSSPVFAGKRLFIMSADPETAAQHVLCYDADQGRLLWKKSYASIAHHLHRRNSFASSTPAVNQTGLFVAWASPRQTILRALDHDGRDRWSLDLGPYLSSHGFATSPMVLDGMVILAKQHREPEGEEPTDATSEIVAVDCALGVLRWRVPVPNAKASYATPCIVQTSGQPPYLVGCNTAEGMFALDPQTGKRLWQLPGLFDKRTVSSPITAHGLIFGSCGSGGGGNYLVAVQPARDSAKEVYRIQRQAPYVPVSVAHDRWLFLWSDKGFVTCLEAKTGGVVWQKRVGGNYSASPIVVDRRLISVSDDGEVLVLAAEEEYRELGRNRLPGPSRSTPAAAHGRIYFRTETSLICIGPGSAT